MRRNSPIPVGESESGSGLSSHITSIFAQYAVRKLHLREYDVRYVHLASAAKEVCFSSDSKREDLLFVNCVVSERFEGTAIKRVGCKLDDFKNVYSVGFGAEYYLSLRTVR